MDSLPRTATYFFIIKLPLPKFYIHETESASQVEIGWNEKWFPRINLLHLKISKSKLISRIGYMKHLCTEDSFFLWCSSELSAFYTINQFIYQSVHKMLGREEGRIKIHVEQHIFMIVPALGATVCRNHYETSSHTNRH